MKVEISTIETVRDLLGLLETDSEIMLMDADAPVAMLAAVKPRTILEGERIPDMHTDVWASDDFDDPMPEQYWNTRIL